MSLRHWPFRLYFPGTLLHLSFTLRARSRSCHSEPCLQTPGLFEEYVRLQLDSSFTDSQPKVYNFLLLVFQDVFVTLFSVTLIPGTNTRYQLSMQKPIVQRCNVQIIQRSNCIITRSLCDYCNFNKYYQRSDTYLQHPYIAQHLPVFVFISTTLHAVA